MPYLHDVFISYKRETLWTPWARDHFKRLLNSYLQQELGQEPDIFVDENIKVGADWVNGLATNLAMSKVMVAVFSRDYFGSAWCIHELDLMLGRSLAVQNPRHSDSCLIVPVVVHDGDLIPDKVCRIQPADFKKFRIACVNENTPLYQDFSVAMSVLAPAVKTAIDSAPEYDEKWEVLCKKRFNEIYNSKCNNGVVEPTYFVAKRPPQLLKPPRMILASP